MLHDSHPAAIDEGYTVNQAMGVIGTLWYAWTPKNTLMGEFESESEAWDYIEEWRWKRRPK